MFAARRALSLWLPPAAYVGLIFYLSSLSYPFELTGAPPAPDWVLHGIEYSVLAALLSRALSGGFPTQPTLFRSLLTICAATAIGSADEVWQSFTPGRWASLLDAVADIVGASFGAAAYAVGCVFARARRAKMR